MKPHLKVVAALIRDKDKVLICQRKEDDDYSEQHMKTGLLTGKQCLRFPGASFEL